MGSIVIGNGRGVLILSSGGGSEYVFTNFLLRDDFIADDAGPLATPRISLPGPGTLTLVQTDGQFSISGGKLAFPAQSTPVMGDQSLWGEVLTRVAGRAVIGVVNFSTASYMALGYDSEQSGTVDDRAISLSGGTWSADGAIELGATASTTTDYKLCIVARSLGGFYFIKGGSFTDWTLVWVSPTGSASVYPVFANYDSAGTLDTFRILDLPAPFDTDYGLATQRLAGSVAQGTTFVHEANCVIEFVMTTLPQQR